MLIDIINFTSSIDQPCTWMRWMMMIHTYEWFAYSGFLKCRIRCCIIVSTWLYYLKFHPLYLYSNSPPPLASPSEARSPEGAISSAFLPTRRQATTWPSFIPNQYRCPTSSEFWSLDPFGRWNAPCNSVGVSGSNVTRKWSSDLLDSRLKAGRFPPLEKFRRSGLIICCRDIVADGIAATLAQDILKLLLRLRLRGNLVGVIASVMDISWDCMNH